MKFSELFQHTFRALRPAVEARIAEEASRHPTWVSNELTAVKLFPLRGRKIILFPDTDPDGKAYTLWYGIAQQAQRLLGQPVTVSPLLELNATAEQKAAKIDLVDMLFTPH